MRISCKTVLIAGSMAASAFLFLAGPGSAHHSTLMFDREKTVTLEGVVKEFQYTNPHSWLIIDVTNPDGTTTTWGFEAEGPSTLLRGGVPKSALPPGTKVTITGHPMKDGRPAGTWTSLVKEDGTVLNWRERN